MSKEEITEIIIDDIKHHGRIFTEIVKEINNSTIIGSLRFVPKVNSAFAYEQIDTNKLSQEFIDSHKTDWESI